MIQSRLLTVSLLAIVSAMTFAASDSSLLAPTPTLNLDAKPTELLASSSRAQASQVSSLFGKPTVGIRVGLGNWNNLIAALGADVTFNVPLIPLPAIRVDYEAWSTTDNFGDRHGNAFSVLGIQNFAMGYAGIGPSYYFSDDRGDHRSGFGAKLLVGVNLPSQTFVEASAIVGEAPVPIFVSVGKRF